MAHRELQGRLQVAEEQVRMYREAMMYLMSPADPPPKSLRNINLSSFPNSTDGWVESADEFGNGADNDVGMSSDKRSGGLAAARGIMEVGERNDVAISDSCSGLSDSTHGLELAGLSTFSDTARKPTAGSANVPLRGAHQHIWGLIERTAGWLAHHEEEVTAPAKRNDMDRQRFAEELEQIKRRRAAVAREREMVAERRAEMARCRRDVLSRCIQLSAMRNDILEAKESCRCRKALYSEQLVSAMNMGALNDSFHIWHKGPFATINGFRVGRLPSHLVDWQEVNAGVGQAALVLVTVAMAMGVEFSKYLIAPCGSFTKIARSEDGRVLYSLHTDESFSLFPRRNFNLALKAFLHCLGEVGEHVQDHDPTLRLPYRIKEKEGTIGGLPVSLGSSLEDWTRALKYMITDLKWIVAWAAKYLPPC